MASNTTSGQNLLGFNAPSSIFQTGITGTATAKPITFGNGQGIAQAAQDKSMYQNRYTSKGYTPPDASTGATAMTAQERELAAIEKAAKGRLATAKSQSDIQRAAMLQTANERIHSQGLDPASNAAWSMQQRATDQAGIEGNTIVNSALNQNTEAMLSEQDQMTQRENALTDQQRSYQMSTLQNIIENSTDSASRVSAANELQKLTGLSSTESGLDFATALGTTTGEADKQALSLLSLRNLEATPENIAAVKEGLSRKDESSVLDALKSGTYNKEAYVAGDATYQAYKTNQKSAADLTSKDWTTLNSKQKSDLLSNTAIVRDGNTNYNTWDNVNQGDVVANQGKAYKVVYNPTNKGVYVESLDKPGTFMYFSSDYPGGRKTTLEDINKRYNKRNGAGWSISGYSSGPNKSFSSVV